MATFKIDRAGIGRYIRSQDVARPIARVAGAVAGNARASTDLPVEVRTGTTDRATATVVLAHPAGIAEQAKHGTLTRAVSAAGLRVRAR